MDQLPGQLSSVQRVWVQFDLVEISFSSVDRAVVVGAEITGFDLIWWRSHLDQLIERLSSVQKLRGSI